jgi:hypothetical protein
MALLSSHFQAIASGIIVTIDTLEIDREYPVTFARRLTIQYGPTVQLTLRTDGDESVKVFLPKRYAELVSDTDIKDINSSIKQYKLIFRGKTQLHIY